MRLITCSDDNYFDYLSVLLRSNRKHDNLPVTVYDWGLSQQHADEARQSGNVELIALKYPVGERMLTKVRVTQRAMDEYQCPILYLDADFMFRASVRSDIENAAAGCDVVVTPLDFREWRPGANRHWLNAGFFFANRTKRAADFVASWLRLSRGKADWWGDQDALRKLTKPYYPTGESELAHIGYLPCSVYNGVPAVPKEQLVDCKLAHMKGENWHNVLTGKVQFPTKFRPEWMRFLLNEWRGFLEMT